MLGEFDWYSCWFNSTRTSHEAQIKRFDVYKNGLSCEEMAQDKLHILSLQIL